MQNLIYIHVCSVHLVHDLGLSVLHGSVAVGVLIDFVHYKLYPVYNAISPFRDCPINTRPSYCEGSMLGQYQRQWPRIEPPYIKQDALCFFGTL